MIINEEMLSFIMRHYYSRKYNNKMKLIMSKNNDYYYGRF